MKLRGGFMSRSHLIFQSCILLNLKSFPYQTTIIIFTCNQPPDWPTQCTQLDFVGYYIQIFCHLSSHWLEIIMYHVNNTVKCSRTFQGHLRSPYLLGLFRSLKEAQEAPQKAPQEAPQEAQGKEEEKEKTLRKQILKTNEIDI